MNLFGKKRKSLNTGRLISLEQAKKYEKDPDYKHYIFPTEITEEGKVMCKPQLVKEIETYAKIEENKEKQPKARWNASFEQAVICGGKYKGIDREVANRHEQPKQYNNWENAKKYRPEQFMR